jgi:hypothetical protein
MKTILFLHVSLLAVPMAAQANTAEYDGEAAYEWHLDPPTLYLAGDAAAHLKQDLKFTPKSRKITVSINCRDPIGNSPAFCEIDFPNP